jgi:hypothetical protein
MDGDPMNYRSTTLSLVFFSLLFGGIAQAGPPDYTIEKITIEGDPSPTSGTLDHIFNIPAMRIVILSPIFANVR